MADELAGQIQPHLNPGLWAAQRSVQSWQSFRAAQQFNSFAAQTAPMFEELGSDQAKQFGQLLRTDPRAAYTIASQFGGFKDLYALMQSGAANQKLAATAASLPPGSPQRTLLEMTPTLGVRGAGVYSTLVQDQNKLQQLRAMSGELEGKSPAEQLELIFTKTDLEPEEAVRIVNSLKPAGDETVMSWEVDKDGVTRFFNGPATMAPVDRRKAAEDRAGNIGAVTDGIKLLAVLATDPTVAGGTGRVLTGIAGIGGQLENLGYLADGSTDSMIKDVANTDPATLQEYRTRAQLFAIGMRKELTGDTSRLSDFDQQQIREATALILGNADNIQAAAATRTILASKIKSDVLKSLEFGVPSVLDPTTPEGADKFYDVMKILGLPEAEVNQFFDATVTDVMAAKRLRSAE